MSALTVVKTNEILSQNDIDVLRNSKFKNFTDSEISYARQVSAHLQLNPLLNQIHFVKRKNNDGTYAIAAQVGIDGFRLAAERTGKYAGSDEPIFEGTDKRPTKATVTVYKMLEGVRCAFTASARWDEYYPGEGSNGNMWRKMPCGQLAKCAEALALRKAFPAELSALRTDEEMAQADAPITSKASSLNNRAPAAAPAPVIEAEVVEEAKPNAAPSCCGREMMISKYPVKEGERKGMLDWYCPKCRSVAARAQ